MCREELIDFSKYVISKEGTIFSKHWNKTIGGWIDDDGYLVNCLTLKNGKRQPYRTNRVIAYLFVDRPEHLKDVSFDELQVGHWDTDRKNNNANNLYWCTSKENNNNPITKEKQRIASSKEESVKRLREGLKKYIENGGKNGFCGKTHSAESKVKQSEARKRWWKTHKNNQAKSFDIN